MPETPLTHDRTPVEAAPHAEQISPLVRRIVAPNATPFTFTGTCGYIIGTGKVAIIDPGPDDELHVKNLFNILGGETVEQIVITHTHRDHSPAARKLQAATGAKIVGCAAHIPVQNAPSGRLDASHDLDHAPDEEMRNGDELFGQGFTLQALATPGHASNHLCFALREEKKMFSGDHVMAWSTSIVAPPDGNMQDYMNSLNLLLDRDDDLYWPGHGAPVIDPKTYVTGLITHRRQREASILNRISEGDHDISTMVTNIYKGLDERLHGAACLSVLAHLEDLTTRGIVETEGPATLTALYRASS